MSAPDAKGQDVEFRKADEDGTVRGHWAGWAGVEHDCAEIGCADDEPNAKARNYPGASMQVCRRFPVGDHVTRCDCDPDGGCPLDAKAVDPGGSIGDFIQHGADAKPVDSSWAVWPDLATDQAARARDALTHGKASAYVDRDGAVWSREGSTVRLGALHQHIATWPPEDAEDVEDGPIAAALREPTRQDHHGHRLPGEPPIRLHTAEGGPAAQPRVVSLGHAWPNTWGAMPMLGRSWHREWGREPAVPTERLLDGFTRNTVAFRAEVPPAPPSTAEAVARAEREKAARAVKHRRNAMRELHRRAARRARGIHPCDHDHNIGDDW